jgi:hypothetical protein
VFPNFWWVLYVYVYDQVTLETDVKPLVGLVDKPLGCVPPGFSGCDYSCRLCPQNKTPVSHTPEVDPLPPWKHFHIPTKYFLLKKKEALNSTQTIRKFSCYPLLPQQSRNPLNTFYVTDSKSAVQAISNFEWGASPVIPEIINHINNLNSSRTQVTSP